MRDGGVRDAGRNPLELPYTSNFDPNLIPPSFGNFDAANGLICRLITDPSTPRFEGLGCESDGAPSVYRTPSGRDVVLVHVDILDVEGTLEIEGPLPALFVVERFADLDGFIVANASGATPGPGAEVDDCGPARDGPTTSGGGGGGFGGAGAAGGRFGSGEPFGAPGEINGAANLIPLRGGCAGGSGGAAVPVVGGGGGGAVQISAFERIVLDGQIYVNGGGGLGNGDGGGSGGGSGGAVLLEALLVDIGDTGRILASGGGGGAGGVPDDGADGNAIATPAAGGGGPTPGGRGGLGPTPPTPGADGAGEGGGGGGGVGRVRINADVCRVDEDARVLPAPSGC
ncbi:MAG: hypothetical protein RMA76_41170 [Deltaproteobacteria bacterium]